MQVVPGRLNAPEPSLEKVTLPDGVEAPAPLLSVTVAVQVVVAPASTGDGRQLTEVIEDAVIGLYDELAYTREMLDP